VNPPTHSSPTPYPPRPPVTDRFVVRYARWLLDHTGFALAASLVFAGLCALALTQIRLNGDYSVFFPEDDPKVRRFVMEMDQYTTNASIFYVVSAKSGDLFTPDALAAIDTLTQDAWDLPHVVRVDSITNYQHARWEDGRLVVGELFNAPQSMPAPALRAARDTVLSAPLLQDRIINDTGDVTGVNVQVDTRSRDLIRQARALRDRIEAAHPNLDLRMTGVVMLNTGFEEATIRDILTMTPIVLVVLVAAMAWLLRSVALTLGIFSVIFLSVLSAMGIAAAIGLEISGPVAPAPIIIMTLAVANGVHILVTMRFQLEHGASRDEAMIESLRLNFAPVMLTSITTMIGFLSMTLRTVPPIRVMATVTAIGVFMSFVYAVVFMPALIARLPVRVPRDASRTQARMRRLADWVIARRTRLLWSGVGVAAALASFLPTLEFNNQFVNFLKERVEIRRDTDYAAENLTGIFQIMYSINAAGPGGVASPEYLVTLDAFRRWLLEQEGVTHVESLSSTVMRLNRLMARGDDSALAIPDSAARIEGMLKLYAQSLPKGLSLRSSVNEDGSASRMVVTTDNLRSREMGELARASEAWLREHAPEDMHAEAMGPWILFADISELMRRSMVLSTPLALVLVSAALVIALRSIRFGAVSLIPNLLPLVAAYGLWAMLGKASWPWASASSSTTRSISLRSISARAANAEPRRKTPSVMPSPRSAPPSSSPPSS